MHPGGEKRKHKRIGRNFTLRVAFGNKGPWPTWSLVTAHDLSAGGVTFMCEQPFQVGDLLFLNIQFMSREIECWGKVIRSTYKPGKTLVELAVRFKGLSARNREYIAHFSSSL